jgi:5-methyltetrahydropteroyltriglutamate--homocysteine methyltransferase
LPHYPPYTTTVVGAHSVPRWYEALDRLVALGQLAEGDFVDAHSERRFVQVIDLHLSFRCF